jgi:hypothetical protein
MTVTERSDRNPPQRHLAWSDVRVRCAAELDRIWNQGGAAALHRARRVRIVPALAVALIGPAHSSRTLLRHVAYARLTSGLATGCKPHRACR